MHDLIKTYYMFDVEEKLARNYNPNKDGRYDFWAGNMWPYFSYMKWVSTRFPVHENRLVALVRN